MCSSKAPPVPVRSTKTQPCHSRTSTGFSPSADLSNAGDVAVARRSDQAAVEPVAPGVVRADDRLGLRRAAAGQQLVAAVPAGVLEAAQHAVAVAGQQQAVLPQRLGAHAAGRARRSSDPRTASRRRGARAPRPARRRRGTPRAAASGWSRTAPATGRPGRGSSGRRRDDSGGGDHALRLSIERSFRKSYASPANTSRPC